MRSAFAKIYINSKEIYNNKLWIESNSYGNDENELKDGFYLSIYYEV